MDVHDTLTRAVAAHRAGDVDGARQGYEAVLEADPENADAWHFGGLLLYQHGHLDEAIAMIERSLALDPAQPAAQNNLGNVLRKVDRAEEAHGAYVAALEMDQGFADAWCNLGVLLRNHGRVEEAEETLEKAIALDATHPETLHNLGLLHLFEHRLEKAADAFEACIDSGRGRWSDPVWYGRILHALGRQDSAIAFVEAHLATFPDDPLARHQLAAMRGEEVERASDGYVQKHFDNFAASFDAVLEGLGYRAPQLVGEMVAATLPAGTKADIADLGCGTGLCGPLLKPYAAQIVGVDLSREMLRQAKRRAVYDYLVEGELTAFLREAPAGAFDLAVSADTLCYFGDLGAVFAALTRALKPGGRLIATVERMAEGERGYAITPSGRYTHSAGHLRDRAAAAGLALVELREAVLRRELGQDVQGYVFALAAPAV